MSQLTEFLKLHEGVRNQAYKCSAGVWTIGVGHTGPEVKAGLVWSLGEVEAALESDALKAVAAVLKAIKPPGPPKIPGLKIELRVKKPDKPVVLTTEQMTACASLAFNIGTHAFASSTLVKKILGGDLAGAAEEFLKWDKITQFGKKVSSAGLAKRRAAERALFLKEK